MENDAKPLPLIGWCESVALPRLGVQRIKVKVDSGAKTSALHAFQVEKFQHDGEDYVRFQVKPLQKRDHPTISTAARLLEYRVVRSSVGHETLRPVIVTDVKLGDLVWPIELTLVDRDAMAFRMLLGRQALAGRFLLDPGRTFLWGHSSPGD